MALAEDRPVGDVSNTPLAQSNVLYGDDDFGRLCDVVLWVV